MYKIISRIAWEWNRPGVINARKKVLFTHELIFFAIRPLNELCRINKRVTQPWTEVETRSPSLQRERKGIKIQCIFLTLLSVGVAEYKKYTFSELLLTFHFQRFQVLF